MNILKNSPPPLKRKMILSALIGVICLLIGVIISFYTKDKMMLCLSIAVFIFSIMKALNMYKIITEKKYEIIKGTCIGIIPRPLRKLRKIQIIDDDGNEISLLLNKQMKLNLGEKYCFYFKEIHHISSGNNYLDSMLTSDSFLGYELLNK